MSRLIKKSSKKVGLQPGVLIHVGERKLEKPRIRVIDYSDSQFEDKEIQTIDECFPYRDTPGISWINIDGLHDVELIEKFGKHFNVHPLVLEDILNTEKRPLMEDYGDYIYMVIKMLYYQEKENIIKAEQISIILCKNLVITFQEGGGDVFEPIRERIRNSKGRLRGSGSDYLAYSLVDSIVDNYFIILEKFSDTLESLEEILMEDISQYDLNELHTLKREMLFLRKSVWPVREIVGNLERSGSPLINQTTIIYLRDLYDHTVQVIDTIETVREMTTGMLEIYLSSVSNRMNEVMKVLTIMASIFIPLTFIAGVYGMNFDNMPELHSKFGYPAVVGFMMLVAISMTIFFKKRNWL